MGDHTTQPTCLSIDDSEFTLRVKTAIDGLTDSVPWLPLPCLGPTYVALRCKGHLKQSYWCYDLDLDQLLSGIVERAIARISELGSDQSIDTIELCLTANYRPIKPSQFASVFSNIYRGLRGIELQYKDQLVRYSPTRMIATNLSFQKVLEQFLQRQGISFDTFVRQGGLIQAFEARQVLVSLMPAVTAVTLHRGNRVVPIETLSGTVLDDLKTQLGQWLLRQVQPDGRMIYKYFPSRGTESEANNLIRQFMATLALIRYARASGQATHWTLAQHNLNYTLHQFYRSEGRLGWVEYDGKAKLGAIALAALAILEYSDGKAAQCDSHTSDSTAWTVAPAYKDLFRGLCATIDTLWQPDGSFRTFYKPAHRNDNQNFYPGEALLFWAKLYSRTQDPTLLDRCYTSFDYYRTWHRNHYNPAFIPWHTQAYALLYKATGDRQFLDAVMEMNDGLLAMQQWFSKESAHHGDIQGRFYKPDADYGPPHASSTGVYLEGLADAYGLALQTQDHERAERYEAVIWRGLRSIRQLQFRDAVDLFYVSDRTKVQGGLRTTVYDNVIRVDNVQHCLMALLKLQQWSAFQPGATPPPQAIAEATVAPISPGHVPLGAMAQHHSIRSIALQAKTRDDANHLQHFQLIHQDVNIQPFLDEIAAHDQLWLHNTSRQDKITVQRETQTIYLRSAEKPFPPGITSSNDVHASRTTSLAEHFPQVMNWVECFAQAQGGELGRVTLVRLAPKGQVYRHIDHGDYYRVRDRFHLVLHSSEGSLLGAGEEWVRMHSGECWWFNNKIPHEACNESNDWRIHLIFDVQPQS
ncbi:MAG: aspartyl/asparaginyl beta-hydroxylase domain-containing protein [Elainellaceae cyanobacterium]